MKRSLQPSEHSRASIARARALRCLKRVLLVGLLLGASVATHAQSDRRDELVASLRQGGFVLFVRHLNTNQDQADTDPLHLENIAAQRQLSAEGRTRAKALGEALRALEIPVERVLASKFKRAVDSAELLALGPVEALLDLTEGGLVVSPRENQRRGAALKALLAKAPSAGKNLLIVSHRPNLQEAAGKEFGDLSEGEIAVFRPLGNAGYKLIARVPSDTWLKWAEAPRKAPRASGAPAP
jgi:phosphohistidine phosphatase SixA